MKYQASWLIAPLAVAIGLASLAGWWALRPRPTLTGVDRLVALGRYEAAETQLREYLRAYPGDEPARVMLARISIDRPDPNPALALEQIAGIRPANPHQAALLKAIEGGARFGELHYDEAEAAWLEALRLEPSIAEVGWKLLNIYALQGRDEDSRRLALRLFAHEPDPHDRVQLLLQLIRLDAHPIEAGSVVHGLAPVVLANPGDVRSTLALGGAQIRSGRAAEGLSLLRGAVESHAEDLDAWSTYLDGLIEVGELDELERALGRIPPSLAASPRFDEARGWLAAQGRDLDRAAIAYGRALEARPADARLAYRFRSVLRQGGKAPGFEGLESRLDAIAKYPDRARELYDQVNALPDLGLRSHPELFGEVAATLGSVGRNDEAEAWSSLVGNAVRGIELPRGPDRATSPAPTTGPGTGLKDG
ncbi:tetratricopeptide repeat protein [Tundrisphaera lichenicola]|uniref:tetratricopeptide repeat protein n=1 Tax=Tundrisphaera lichenicola TaxID=2029860 RepID=UPI003EC07301